MNDKIYEQTVENLKIKELSIKITFSQMLVQKIMIQIKMKIMKKIKIIIF